MIANSYLFTLLLYVFLILFCQRGIFMYDIMEYKKKKLEENLNFLIDLIINKILDNLDYKIIFHMNFMITGYNDRLNEIVNRLSLRAKDYGIDLVIDTRYVPSSSTNLVITASKTNDMFLNFMLKESEFYNRIININKTFFDIYIDKLNNLCNLNALQTAFYHAGYDVATVDVNGKVYNLNICNYTKKYYPKVVLMDMIKYYSRVEAERKNNINKKILNR